jgi:hypothetical protein
MVSIVGGTTWGCALVLCAVCSACSSFGAGSGRTTEPLLDFTLAPERALEDLATGRRLVGGCVLDVPVAVDADTWLGEHDRSTATLVSAKRGPRLALDARRSLMLWMEVSPDGNFDLRASLVDEHGSQVAPPMIVSSNVVGRPFATSDSAGRARIWFIQEADRGDRRLVTTLRCAE